MPILYIFSGLPASGKSTLAARLAAHTGSVYVRIDTIEQGLKDLYALPVRDEGYRLAYRFAQDNLAVGTDVIADSCNPIELTRRAWREVATAIRAHYVDIEVICSNREEHQARVEGRTSTIAGLQLPSWSDVQAREYH